MKKKKEWDGLARLCFQRKNKILSSIFKSKQVTQLLATNYKTYCSLQNIPIDEEFSKEPEKFIKSRVEAVLEKCGLSNARIVKCDNDQLLQLLSEFNKVGIHFT